MAQLIDHDLTRFTADLYIIPHSTNGNLSPDFSKFVDQVGLSNSVPRKARLGDVEICPTLLKDRKFYVAMACTVEELTSTYTSVYKICREVAQAVPPDVHRIATPLLGTGGGRLAAGRSYAIINQTFAEYLNPEIPVTVCANDEKAIEKIYADYEDFTGNAEQLVLEYSLEELMDRHWVKELVASKDYYFNLAVRKFREFRTFEPLSFSFKDLSVRFLEAQTVFSRFLTAFDEQTEEYFFLKLCGELIAYIDRHAYNKNTWNLYDDKRTMALSSVNQTRWIENLLNYRANGNLVSGLSPSIRNALAYLLDPKKQMTMLSVNHRRMVAQAFFNGVIENEFLDAVWNFFGSHHLVCLNPENNGVLFSRIFYAPDIKYLWLKREHGAKALDTHRTTAPDEAGTDEKQALPEAAEVRMRNLRSILYSDLYAQVDLLNYEMYASVIAGMITNGLSKPPFNISILAPWGKGKTSMMKFVECKLRTNKADELDYTEKPSNSFRTVYRWLRKTDELIAFKKLEHPVIWFNAWKFQKSEQVWAGLADGILDQIAEQLGPVDRERFWLKLNLKRIDRDKLKRELILNFVQKCLVPGAYLIGGFLLSFLFTKFDFSKLLLPLFQRYPVIVNAVPFVAGLVTAVCKAVQRWNKPPELELSKFLLQPEYRQKMGYLQMVEDDLRQAIRLAIDPERPAVVFIDDLDRCPPKVIGELIEAINAFMTGEMSQCYFILGQDPQMVAASLDVAYSDIGHKTGAMNKQSIGRFFLEKFSQLSFNLPVMTKKQTDNFVRSLLSAIDLEQIPDEAEQKELLASYADLEKELDSLDDPEQIFGDVKTRLEARVMIFAPHKIAEFQDKILTKAFTSYDLADNELENMILDIATFLGNSPRTVKRFLNLYLFYRFLRFTEAGRVITVLQPHLLCRFLVIMVRWPLLVEAIQWDTQACFVYGATPFERATKLDDMLTVCATHEDFLALVNKDLGEAAGWLTDPQLYEICKDDKVVVLLRDAVTLGLW